jgi:hypothetical protein
LESISSGYELDRRCTLLLAEQNISPLDLGAKLVSGPLINGTDLELGADLKTLNLLNLATDFNGFLQFKRDWDVLLSTEIAFINFSIWKIFQGTQVRINLRPLGVRH